MRQATLQEQYNLIVEGKGNINAFHKQALKQFPHLFTAQSSFDQVVTVLKQKSIISEMVAQGLVSNSSGPNFFEIFNTNMAKLNEEVKAEEKKTSKEVEDTQSHNYDYKNKKSIDNHSGAEFLLGFYVESRNAKNVDKTVEQIRDIVVKNLAKNPLHYVESGQFGVEGLGYTEEAPGLGKTKEVTGKYKSSGMEPVKLNEDKDRDKIAKYEKYTYTLDGKKVKPDDIDFYGHILGIEIDGEVYRPGIPDEKGNIELKPRKGKTGMYTESKHSDEADLKIYKSELNMLNKIKPTGEKQLKRKAELEKKISDLEKSMNEIGMFHDPRTSSSFKNDADKWENGALHVRIQMLKNRGINADEAKELATTHENKPWEEVKKLLNLNEMDAYDRPTGAMMIQMADNNPEQFKKYIKMMKNDPGFRVMFMKKLSDSERKEFADKLKTLKK